MITDISGMIFGRLTAVSRNIVKSGKYIYWDCLCTCGKTKAVRIDHLRTNKIQSCGCYMVECIIKRTTTHGQSHRTPEYTAWRAMIQRVNSKSYHAKKRYKQRGISICDRWRNSFENFLSDMGEKPSPKHSLDRYPDKDGNYEPSNCRWATWDEQQNNKSGLRHITYNNTTKTLTGWANFFEVSPTTLSEHLDSKSMDDIFSYYKTKKGVSL